MLYAHVLLRLGRIVLPAVAVNSYLYLLHVMDLPTVVQAVLDGLLLNLYL